MSSISIKKHLTWIGSLHVIRLLTQILSVAIFSRLLNSSDFGVMAIVTSISTFATLFKDIGTGSAIIQRHKVDDSILSSVFWLNLALGFLIFLSIFLSADFLARFFQEARLEFLLMILSPIFVIASLSIVQQALMDRDSNFRQQAIIEIISRVISFAIGIAFAFKYKTVVAFIVMAIIQAFLSTFLYWFYSSWKPKMHFDLMQVRSIFSYSTNLFFFGLINYIHRNADTLLIGKFAGSVQLGFYDLAYKLMFIPVQSLSFLVNKASFPSYSRNQLNVNVILDHYLQTLEVIAIASGIFAMILWGLNEQVVLIFLGEKWLPSAAILSWLAPLGFFQALVATSGTILSCIGRTDILRNLALIGVPLLTLAIALGLSQGITGVAMYYSIASIVWTIPVMHVVFSRLNSDIFKFFSTIARPLLIAVISGLIANYIAQQLKFMQIDLYLTFLASMVSSLGVYVLLSLALLRNTIIKLLYR